ncbi:MAG: peptidoglycan/LPS O-acetylase OafA/YrhL [Colwellia sp.]|jgi:peptidoglycan/LPS O-acetylase OafA/YrhL
MNFRKDINGLRAIAVIAVVIFHFNKDWLPGGFAGVDVFFVISGFLMTSIIIKGLKANDLSLANFYFARANRIIPPLFILCMACLIFGYIFLIPFDYQILSQHVKSSAGFFSNATYMSEAGYFDSASHDKWLLHTWSLSVEWQFYIIYPVILLISSRLLSLEALPKTISILAALSFILCVIASFYWSTSSFYSLTTRAWEMLLGGVIYFYPLKMKEKNRLYTELTGIILISVSYLFLNGEDTWPGTLTLLPVVGACLILLANNNQSIISKSTFIQKIGTYSYSIYLWHWPVYVALNHFRYDGIIYSVLGIIVSLILGMLSYYLIEKKLVFNYKNLTLGQSLRHPTVVLTLTSVVLASLIQHYQGLPERFSSELQSSFSQIASSPLKEKCHSGKRYYIDPSKACTYFAEDIKWAVLGDSHTVEIAYALANAVKAEKEGIKHYSFSSCIPSYKQNKDFSRCATWTTDAVADIVNNSSIENVVINYRYSRALFGDIDKFYPALGDEKNNAIRKTMLQSLKMMINDLAKSKKNIYVFLPIPELQDRINKLISNAYTHNLQEFRNINGTSYDYYLRRNEYILNFFTREKFPENVMIIKPSELFCDAETCFAMINGVPLYFDDDHPSIKGSELLIQPIIKDYKKG